jgi:hypothetical protein
MKIDAGRYYDPETIRLMKAVLEAAWEDASMQPQLHLTRSIIAERILKAAGEGERDPERLRVRAFISVVAS